MSDAPEKIYIPSLNSGYWMQEWHKMPLSNRFISKNEMYIRADIATIAAAISEKIIREQKEVLGDILSRFKSCIAQGNGEIEGDKEAIERAEELLK